VKVPSTELDALGCLRLLNDSGHVLLHVAKGMNVDAVGKAIAEHPHVTSVHQPWSNLGLVAVIGAKRL
jgi:hypothetical protein